MKRTKASRRYRAVAWQPAPTFADVHDLSVYSRDNTSIRPATLTLVASLNAVSQQYLTTPVGTIPDWCDDSDDDETSLKYVFARSALAALRRSTQDPAASNVQRYVRGQQARRRLRLLARARARWRHRGLSTALRKWAHVAHGLRAATYSLQSLAAALLNRQLSRGWRTWQAYCAEMVRRDAVKYRVLARLLHGKWYTATWRSWTNFVACARKVETIVKAAALRMIYAASALAWRSWLNFVQAERQSQRALLFRRAAARLFDSGLRSCMRAIQR